jgi:hypothetical protein
MQNIRLAALIIADEAVATPLVLGRSLTELQIARVVSAGARHVVCLVRQVSSQILAVADNLRANGLTIDIVRSVADAADAIHPDEAVFLVASQVLVSGKTLGELLSSGPPSLLCVGNDVATSQFEIIDATTRWTGYALLDGATLRSVAVNSFRKMRVESSWARHKLPMQCSLFAIVPRPLKPAASYWARMATTAKALANIGSPDRSAVFLRGWPVNSD